MADEPRRSVRATKGQHTKSLDLLDQPAEMKKKPSKKAAKKAAAQEEEVEVIRCVCGAVETGDDEGEAWIACDNCGVWQHNICMGISPFEEDTPETYLCEQCAPEAHKELLEGIKRGEKPWEDRRKAHEKEQAEQEQEASKKKGKKGKVKRTSDPKSELSHDTNGSKAKSPSAPISTGEVKEKKEPVARTASTKRKARDESHEKEAAKGPQSKIRKVSAAQTPQEKSPASELPAKISDLDSARRGPATLILKALLHGIPIAVKSGVYRYKNDDTLDKKAQRLAIEVEDAVFKTHDSDGYKKQARALFNNIKQNQELCNGLLANTLSPSALAVMTTDQMATEELQRETAEMKARSDKQAIMITDDGPRMRRTHKGDEVVGGDNFAVPEDSSTSISRRRSMLDPNADMATRSRENSPGDQVELPESIDDYRSRDDIRSQVSPKLPLSVETKPSQSVLRKASTQGDFDIKKVFSSVQSPVGVQHIRRPSVNAPPVNGPGVDLEIDKMLQDDDVVESPPYSPAEYSSDPDIVWHGTVTMDSIAKFPAIAKHIGGADLGRSGSQIPWSDVLQKDLKVAGRIDQDKANEYLCSLRYSPPTDVVIVAVTPTGEAAALSFQDMFDYFHSKKRYGVLTNKGIGNIRDTYLVPVPASPGQLPDFIINLEGHKMPENRPEPMILVALVIRNEWQPDSQRSFDGSTEVQSPSVMGHPQRQMSMGGTGPSMSPIAPQGSFPSPTPLQQSVGGEDSLRRHQQEEQRLAEQREGEATAARILGAFINAPTVHFLLPQAFQMRRVEWEVIRDILEKDPKAQQDLAHLSQLLELRMSAENKKPNQS